MVRNYAMQENVIKLLQKSFNKFKCVYLRILKLANNTIKKDKINFPKQKYTIVSM